MKLFAVLTALLLPALAQAGEAPEWTLLAKDSAIGFTARQMGVPLKGAFQVFGGSIRFDPDNLAGSRVQIEIRPASAKTGRNDVDQYLGNETWFDAAKFPLARYEATKFLAKGQGRYEALGQLTLRGATRDLALPFTLAIASDGDKLRAEAKGEVTLRRLAFGVGQGEWRATDVVADEVQVTIIIVAERAKSP